MSELKPCPFCNGPNIVVIEREDKEHPDTVYSMAQCGDCLTEGPLELDYIQAGEKWNCRAESAELAARTAERDSLREAVKRRDGVIEWLLEFYDEPDWKRGEVAKRLQEVPK